MSQHNTCVRPTGERPGGSELQEVSGVMRENGSLCGSGKGQLGGIIDSEMIGVAGGQTIDSNRFSRSRGRLKAGVERRMGCDLTINRLAMVIIIGERVVNSGES